MRNFRLAFGKGLRYLTIVGFSLTLIFYTNPVFASGAAAESGADGMIIDFFWIAIILIVAKLASLVERFGQPAVLGELVVGVLLGNLALLGLNSFEVIKSDPIIAFLSELGVILLLFQIGLESNLEKMKKVGGRAFLVACVGVIAPFVLGTYLVGPWLLPNLSFQTYLFIGATLTATSVGITARVFQDLKKLHLPEAQIVLGAAVIDDVLGLIILAVVSSMVTLGAVTLGLIGWIAAKALLFLIGSIVIGQFSAPRLGKLLAKIHAGVGMKITLAISFCFMISYLAALIGLAPIIGAFAAGLVLDPVHFRYFKDPKIVREIRAVTSEAPAELKKNINQVIEHHSQRHVEDLIQSVGHLFIPIFFVLTGMQVDLAVMFDLPILLVALGITAAAFVSKIVAGLAAGKKVNRYLIGFGMVPRGEVGLIFAMVGKNLGVVSDQVFSIIVIMVILTTLFTPPILTFLLKKHPN